MGIVSINTKLLVSVTLLWLLTPPGMNLSRRPTMHSCSAFDSRNRPLISGNVDRRCPLTRGIKVLRLQIEAALCDNHNPVSPSCSVALGSRSRSRSGMLMLMLSLPWIHSDHSLCLGITLITLLALPRSCCLSFESYLKQVHLYLTLDGDNNCFVNRLKRHNYD